MISLDDWCQSAWRSDSSARRRERLIKVIVTGARDMARACGGFLDDVEAGRVSHSDQPPLNAAVAGARRRPIGDAGAFGWDRRDGSVFVAPLVAVTLADQVGAALG